MLSKLLEIELTRQCLLVLTDVELMAGLPQEMLARGLRRGKAIQRKRKFQQREKKRYAERV